VLRMRQGDRDLTRFGPGDRLARRAVAGLEDVEREFAGGRRVVTDESAGLVGWGLPAEQAVEELPVGRDDDPRHGPALPTTSNVAVRSGFGLAASWDRTGSGWADSRTELIGGEPDETRAVTGKSAAMAKAFANCFNPATGLAVVAVIRLRVVIRRSRMNWLLPLAGCQLSSPSRNGTYPIDRARQVGRSPGLSRRHRFC
jgi:hypothetical protein